MPRVGAAAFTWDGVLVPKFLANLEPLPGGARGRESHALVGIAAGGLGSVPRADRGAGASSGEIPCMGAAPVRDVGPARHGGVSGLLPCHVGSAVSAPIRVGDDAFRRRAVDIKALAMVAMGAGCWRLRNPVCRSIGARAPSTRTSRSRTRSSGVGCSCTSFARSARDVATSPHRGVGRRRGDAVPLRARAATGGRRRRQEADDQARTVVHPLLSQEVETGAAGSPAELARLRVSEGARARTSTAARGRESARRALGGASCRDSESPVDWADVRSSVLSRICGIATTGRPMQGAAGWRWRRLPGGDAHLSDVRHEGG